MRLASFALGCLSVALGLNTLQAEDAAPISFERVQLDARFRSEGVSIGDFNKDGHMDISAGECLVLRSRLEDARVPPRRQFLGRSRLQQQLLATGPMT